MELYEVIDIIQVWIRTVQEVYRDEISIEFLMEDILENLNKGILYIIGR